MLEALTLPAEMFYENLPEVLVASFEQEDSSSKSSLVVYAHIREDELQDCAALTPAVRASLSLGDGRR